MDILKKIFKTHPAHKPFIVKPPDSKPSELVKVSYCETEADEQIIAGTGIIFGKVEKRVIDEDENTKDITQSHSYLIGSARKLVSSIDQIAGACPFCELDNEKLIKAGKISKDEAKRLSLVDISSVKICTVCGIQTCSIHTTEVVIDGEKIIACVKCQKKLKPSFIKMIARFLYSLFSEKEASNE